MNQFDKKIYNYCANNVKEIYNFEDAFRSCISMYHNRMNLNERETKLFYSVSFKVIEQFTMKHNLISPSGEYVKFITLDNLVYFFDLAVRLERTHKKQVEKKQTEEQNLNCSMFSQNPIEEINTIINTTFLK